MKSKTNGQLSCPFPVSKEIEEMLEVDLIKKTIQTGMPSLLDGSPDSYDILDKIHEYLFEQNSIKQSQIEDLITEELSDLLLGLKKLLKRHHLHFIQLGLEEHQNRYARWIKKEVFDQKNE